MQEGELQMKIGLCTPTKNIEKVKEIGYDYIEVAGNEIAAMTEEEFNAFVAKKETLGYPVAGFNAYCNDKTPIVGDGFSEEKAKAYAEKMCARGAKLGIKNIGVGAPGARKLPAGYDMDKAYAQCEKFLEITATEAAKYGINVLFEALHDKCCDFANHTADGIKMVKKINMDNLKIVLDFYHMEAMGEDITDLKDIMPYVRHLHCNHTPEGTLDREYIVPEDEEMLMKIKKAVSECGYDGTISIEPNDTPDFDKVAPVAYVVMKKVFG